MKVNTTKPAYVFLKNFGNTADNTCNLVQVPPVGCNGKTDIMIADASRVVEANFSTTTLLLMARNSGTSKPEVYINETLRAAASADKTASSSDGKWTIYKMKIGNATNNVKNVRVVYDGSVQVQLLGASGDAGYGGYYNGFAQSALFDIIVENPRFNQVCTSDTGNTILKPELLNYVGIYKWYKNNVLIEGINTQTYQLTENDTDPAIYRMEVLMPDGCSYYTETIQSVKCPCSKEPNNNVGVLYPGIVGVSTTDNVDKIWPNNVNNAFLSLKSNDKGLVITRIPDPETSIISPIEGMIVYDTDDNCYKLFDGSVWKCLRKKCYDYDN
ncbi:MAG: hypothetical protein KIG88_06670 [Weeksellaceae bacterium]|nr:hypothetical protein [Weeksellaceae bacterium]